MQMSPRTSALRDSVIGTTGSCSGLAASCWDAGGAGLASCAHTIEEPVRKKSNREVAKQASRTLLMRHGIVPPPPPQRPPRPALWFRRIRLWFLLRLFRLLTAPKDTKNALEQILFLPFFGCLASRGGRRTLYILLGHRRGPFGSRRGLRGARRFRLG